jgi:hypothetical protein
VNPFAVFVILANVYIAAALAHDGDDVEEIALTVLALCHLVMATITWRRGES